MKMTARRFDDIVNDVTKNTGLQINWKRVYCDRSIEIYIINSKGRRTGWISVRNYREALILLDTITLTKELL